jgi:hypothetical protein
MQKCQLLKSWTVFCNNRLETKIYISFHPGTHLRDIRSHTAFARWGEPSHRGNARNFKFKLGWLACDGFFDLVKEAWESENRGRSPMERWQNKIR